MEVDATVESLYRSITQIYYDLFHVTGLLPYSDDEQANSWRLKIYISKIAALILNTIYYSWFVGHAIKMILSNRRFELDFVFEIVLASGIYYRYFIMYYCRWDFFELMKICNELWRSFVKVEEAKTVKAFENRLRIIGYLIFGSTAMAISSYIVTAQIIRYPPIEPNGTETRILPVRYYVDVQDEPLYTIVTVWQAITGYSVLFIMTSIEVAGPFFIMMACGYLKVIYNRLIAIANNEVGDELPKDQVLACVKFHQGILIFCEKIGEFTRFLFMIQVMCTIYNMALVALKVLENNSNTPRYALLFTVNLMQFFSCQWIPQHLLDQSEAIAEAAYNAALLHRHFNRNANDMLRLMILRAYKTVQLTAGGIIRLSLENFKEMMVNAFSFFTVLRSFNE